MPTVRPTFAVLCAATLLLAGGATAATAAATAPVTAERVAAPSPKVAKQLLAQSQARAKSAEYRTLQALDGREDGGARATRAGVDKARYKATQALFHAEAAKYAYETTKFATTTAESAESDDQEASDEPGTVVYDLGTPARAAEEAAKASADSPDDVRLANKATQLENEARKNLNGYWFHAEKKPLTPISMIKE
ncbi:hypothetical protein [Streptomyces sp. NPDC058401]|uniref:hypothetical protein n=1 Tax=Streptomyces sp. NPDC058401 TaxID=3346480 RepID=UPI00365C6EF2